MVRAGNNRAATRPPFCVFEQLGRHAESLGNDTAVDGKRDGTNIGASPNLPTKRGGIMSLPLLGAGPAVDGPSYPANALAWQGVADIFSWSTATDFLSWS